MTAILEKLSTFWRGKKKNAWLEYRAYVSAIAAGKDVDPTKLDATMQAIGRAEDDLLDDVAHVQKRQVLIPLAKQLPDVLAANKAAEAKHAEFQAKRERIKAELDKEGWAIDQATTQAQAALQAAQAAHVELESDCRDLDIIERNRKLSQQRQQELGDIERLLGHAARDKSIVYNDESADWPTRGDYDRYIAQQTAKHTELSQRLATRTAYYDAEQAKLLEEARCSPL